MEQQSQNTENHQLFFPCHRTEDQTIDGDQRLPLKLDKNHLEGTWLGTEVSSSLVVSFTWATSFAPCILEATISRIWNDEESHAYGVFKRQKVIVESSE